MNIHDIEIERAVIGAILSFETLKEKVLLLDADDFSFKDHVDLLSEMKDVVRRGDSFDFLTLANKLGAEYRPIIEACIKTFTTEVMFEEHFKLLKEMACRRRIINKFNLLTMDGDVSLSTLQQLIDDEEKKRINVDLKETNDKNIDEFVKTMNLKKGAIMTGFGGMDQILGGIRKGTVFIVGARPSTGKTAFAINIASNQMKDEAKKVLFFSLEMSAEMIFERIFASTESIEYERFSRNTLDVEDICKVYDAAEALKNDGRFLIVDDVYNVEHICNLITEHKPSLAVVDFMQIISSTSKFENVRAKIDYISSLFKRTAKATGCVILVLSQLSRVGKEAPTMSDLKESGGLEQDGDYIALMHRPYVLNKADPNITPEHTELLLDKNKFGRTGKLNFHFDLKHQKFYEESGM